MKNGFFRPGEKFPNRLLVVLMHICTFAHIHICTFTTLLVLSIIYQLFICWGIYFPWSVSRKKNSESPGVAPCSIVICARNEAENLKRNLPAVLSQKHPDFEVVVIDDDSQDNSLDVLNTFKKEQPNLTIISVSQKKEPGKRAALLQGIRASRNEFLVLTDADCMPSSPEWLTRMLEPFNEKTDLVLGYSPMKPRNGLLNAFCRYETTQTAMNYLSFANSGMPYMGVGRNIAWRKASLLHYFENENIPKIASGDDDLAVNSMATKNNCKQVLHPKALVYTNSPDSWGNWFRQKRRHLSAGRHYKLRHKLLLGAHALSFTLVWPLVFFLFKMDLAWVAAGPGVMLLSHFTVFVCASGKLKSTSLIVFWPVLFAMELFYRGILSPIVLWVIPSTSKW